jgi:hypothetical protein
MTFTRSWVVAGCRHREAHRPHSSGTGQLNGPGWELGASEDIATARAGAGGNAGLGFGLLATCNCICADAVSLLTPPPALPSAVAAPASGGRLGNGSYGSRHALHTCTGGNPSQCVSQGRPAPHQRPEARAADPSQKSKRPHKRYRPRPHPPWQACTHMTPPRCPRRPRAGRRARPRRSCGTTRSGARGSLRVHGASALTSAGVS